MILDGSRDLQDSPAACIALSEDDNCTTYDQIRLSGNRPACCLGADDPPGEQFKEIKY